MAGKPMAPAPLADDQWIRLAVARYEAPLTLYASRILADADRARDVVQEAFLRLCTQDRKAVEGHLAEWLYSVCRNYALDIRRKGSRMAPLVDEEARHSDEPSPAEVVEARESASGVLRLLGSLPANQQEVIRLKFQHGLSYKQISAITGLSVSNVGFLIHVGVKSLRSQMLAPGPNEVAMDGERP